MGLGALIRRPPAPDDAHARAITEFAVIDGVAVDGSGEYANRYRGAMSIPGAWRASNLIADLLGSVPWDAYKRNAGTRRLELISKTPPLLEQPSPPDTRMTTISSLALDLLYHGNAIEVIAGRSPSGWPTATLPVPAHWCGVRRITDTDYSPLPVGAIEYNIGGLRLASWEVIHTKGPCEPGALKGMGVLEHHMNGGALGLAAEQMRQASNLANAGIPTGYLYTENPDTTDDELRAMKAKWLASQRDRTIAALNASVKFESLAWNPEQMQMVEARRYTLTDLELIFGLPVGWLGGLQSSKQYSNIEADAVNLLKFTLRGPLARFEQSRTLVLPRGTEAKANLDAVLRADTLTRYQAHEIALRNRFKSTDEVRAEEDLPPMGPHDDALAQTRTLAEILQKVYLAVGKVITEDEARAIANTAGAHLPIPAPPSMTAVAPPPAPSTEDGADDTEDDDQADDAAEEGNEP